MLLHGAPGTGKSSTAESIAEFCKRPLYRVALGDIGATPEDVEKYLQVVLLLGKTWDCVILLEEADVFLEQRRMFDIERNALITVFLRVLDYFDGILILTSTRVGAFDETFKSRIQLSLRYDPLKPHQRLQIWQNLLTHLDEFNLSDESSHREIERVVVANEPPDNLVKLSMVEMNGREIRNAISTARQLAIFRKERMTYQHLELVIQQVRRFDDNLSTSRNLMGPRQ